MNSTSGTLRALFLALSSSLAFAAELPSNISAVTVYGDRAMVTRQASVTLDSTGLEELVLTGLPLGLNPESVQVSGAGIAEVSIVDVSIRDEQRVEQVDQRIRDLNTKLEALRLDEAAFSDLEEVLDGQEAYLAQIRNHSVSQQPEGQARPSVAEWGQLLAFNAEQLTALNARKRELSVQAKELSEKISQVQRQLAQEQGERGRTVRNVCVRVKVAKPGNLGLQVSYVLPGASWTPAYDARVDTVSSKVELGYNALVRNATGEAWDKVALTLSTAKPKLGGGAPELSPWFVDVLQPRRVQMMQDKAAAPAAAFEKRAKGLAVNEELLEYSGEGELGGVMGNFLAQAPRVQAASKAVAAVDFQYSGATFKVENPVSLATDGTAQKVPVASIEMGAKLQFETTPKLRENAFLTAYLNNGSAYPVLAGQANIFLDGAFVTVAPLRTIMPGESFNLALGADEAVAVKRREVNRFVENTGITGKYRTTTFEYELTLTNNRREAVHVVAYEQLPISRNEKIEVKLLQPESRQVGTKEKPLEVTAEEDGKLVWRLDLKPGEKRVIPLKFAIEHPLDLQVTGF